MTKYEELKKPIVFIGTGRSGTTIISEIIMRHPDLAFPSNYQNKNFKYPSINLMRRVFDQNKWNPFGKSSLVKRIPRTKKLIFQPNESYSMWNYLAGPGLNFSREFLLDSEVDQTRQEFIRNYFLKMVKYQGKKRLVFKITGPSRIGFLLSIFPDAQFIHLKRKQIPTISSFLKVGFWKQRGYKKLWWLGAYSKEEQQWAEANANDPILLTAFQLKKIIDTTKSEFLNHNPGFLEINYEDFVENPKQEVRNIIEFLNLENAIPYCNKYLDMIEIYNGNKPDLEYFTQNELNRLYALLDR